MIAMPMQNAQTETDLIIVPAIMDTMAMALTAQVQVSFYLPNHFVFPETFWIVMVCIWYALRTLALAFDNSLWPLALWIFGSS